MRLFLLYFTCIFLINTYSFAQSDDRFEKYSEPSFASLTDFIFDSGVIKLKDNKDVIDYLQMKDCTLFTLAKDDIFVQQQMLQQISEGQKQRINDLKGNLYVRLPVEFYITKYNFVTQSFDLSEESFLSNVGVINIFSSPNSMCNENLRDSIFPTSFDVKLNFPVSMRRIPMQPGTAKTLMDKLSLHPRRKDQKAFFGYMYITIEGVSNTLDSGLGGKKIAQLLGQVEAIDLFLDIERQKRLKRLDYSAAY